MPQQINIFTPVLLTQKRYFSAFVIIRILAVLILCSSSLYSYWIWEIGVAANELKRKLLFGSRELKSLQIAIKKNGLKGIAAVTVSTQVQGQRAELLKIEKIISTLQQGVTQTKDVHSVRLELLAQTIPTNVWLTGLSIEERQLVITGLTFDPALLETWIVKLVKNPILKTETLQAVKVENVKDELGGVSRPIWSFSFAVTLIKPIVVIEAKP